ncbi:MAG: sugar ABC transporter permease [Chloroflexota bacterium]
MSETMTRAPSVASAPAPVERRSLLRSLELDTRLLGMLGSLVVIWVLFNIGTGGQFLSARNLWNLSVQTSSVAVMATGMVFIIVSRNIDLSVGSVLGVTGMFMALLQQEWIPQKLGLGYDMWWLWIVTVIAGLLLGGLIGLLQGFLVAYVLIPSFVVTLGGLLVWRAVTFVLAQGRTVSPLDATFTLLGGGPKGAVGDTVSWIIGIVVCVAIVLGIVASRRRKLRFGFPTRPVAIDVIIGVIGCVVVLGAVYVANSYPWPSRLATQYAQEHGIVEPAGGLIIPTGIANPVLLALGVAALMTVLATRRRFGRYVFAIGGNPEAAVLGGINTRRVILMTFVIMGVLAAVSAVISTARLQSAVSGLGTGAELSVIAAAVIGGTSFAGGIGTIPGAVLGALIIQSLVSGMQLMKFDNASQDIAVGVVLVAAVGIDQTLRRWRR